MLKLLEDMANDSGGLKRVPATFERSSSVVHSLDLLEDAGLAVWISDSRIRITNDGYDFLNAIRQDRPKYTAKAKELLGQGKSLLSVVGTIVGIVTALSG